MLSAELVRWFAEDAIAQCTKSSRGGRLFERLFIWRRQTECNLTSHELPNSILKGYTDNILQLLIARTGTLAGLVSSEMSQV
jgi:hypothetical protein